MAEQSRFWITNASPTGDQSAGYSGTNLQDVLRAMFTCDPTTQCVVDSDLTGFTGRLAVTAGSGNVSVATGYGMNYGLWYSNDSALTITIPTPTVATRKDRIVLCANLSGSAGTPPGGVASQAAFTVRTIRITQSEGVGTAPGVAQSGSWWQIPLATVTITTGGVISVTDERGFLKSPAIRGAVDGSTIEWDATGKQIRIKDAGVTGAKLSNPLSYSGQLALTKAGGSSSGAIVLTATGMGIGFNDSTQTTDEKWWDVFVAAKTYKIRLVTDSQLGAVDAFTITRGTGTAISSIALGGNTSVTGTFSCTGTASVGNGSFTNAMLANEAQATIKGRAAGAGTGAPSDLTADQVITILNTASSSTLDGTHVTDDTIANTELANMAQATLKGRAAAAGTGDPTDLTADQAITLLNTASSSTLNGARIATGGISSTQLATDAVTTVKITDANVTTAKLAADSVDDTIVGNRVPAFIRRQGGSSTDWSSAGTTTQTPTMVREQAGVVTCSVSGVLDKSAAIGATVTFPTAFSNPPIVFCNQTASGFVITAHPITVGASSFQVYITNLSGSTLTASTIQVAWRAIGPE